MTLVELIAFLIGTAGLLSGAVCGAHFYGIMGGVCGGIAGAVLGYALGSGFRRLVDAYPVFFWIIFFPFILPGLLIWGPILGMAKVLEKWRSRYPPCKNGCCGVEDYQPEPKTPVAVREHFQRARSRRHVWPSLCSPRLVRCRCGDLYVLIYEEGGFYHVMADGSLRRYMHFRPFGKWKSTQRPGDPE